MEIDLLSNKIKNKSDWNLNESFSLINFFYSPSRSIYEEKFLTLETKKNINESKETLNILKTVPNLNSKFLSSLDDAANFIINADNLEIRFVKAWLECLKSNRKNYEFYLDKIKYKEINYIIICEAPPLYRDKKSNELISKYVFNSDIDRVGKYRIAPYDAINTLNNPNYISQSQPVGVENLISLFVDNQVAFIDAIEFPLPLNPSLRKSFSESIYYMLEEKKPRFISFLDSSIEHFFSVTKCTINKDVKIALMMPPISANGVKYWSCSEILKSNDFTSEILMKFYTALNSNKPEFWQKALVFDKNASKDELVAGLISAFKQ